MNNFEKQNKEAPVTDESYQYPPIRKSLLEILNAADRQSRFMPPSESYMPDESVEVPIVEQKPIIDRVPWADADKDRSENVDSSDTERGRHTIPSSEFKGDPTRVPGHPSNPATVLGKSALSRDRLDL